MSDFQDRLRPRQGIRVASTNKYLFDPELISDAVDEAEDWATKTDGQVAETDYSSKAYAIGGTGTETNNSKYYASQASTSATNASNSATSASNSATTAQNWATKTDGKVDGTDYSAKYYAQSILPIATEITTVAGIASDVATVSGISTDVSAVAGNTADISAVASDLTNIDSVASDMAGVSAVANNLTNINAVNSNKTNINKVASDINRVDLVADDINNVHDVGVNINDVIDVASNLTDISAVNSNKTNIDKVATNIANVNAVASNETNINEVNANKSNINAVQADLTNIDTVAGNISDVNAVAGVSSAVSAVGAIADDLDDVISNATNITTVADNITDVASVGSNIANVNTVAGDSTAINSCANNMTAINNAPTYANNSKIWAEGLDGEVAPLGGTHSSKGWAQIAEAAASGVQNPANRDLSNLTNTGQMVIDSQNGTISNCILEIPQNLKIEDDGLGTITLKAGSIITNSGSTYSTITTTQDYVFTDTGGYANRNYYLFLFPNGLGRIDFSQATSGDTDSLAGVINHIWFDTTNKVINHYTDTSTTPARTLPYPLAVINRQGGTFYKIIKDSNGNDMIFNGIGFIGHHAFVYPNVKGLLSNGFNDDGSLKSISRKNNALRIVELQQNYNTIFLTNWSGYITKHNYSGEVDTIEDMPTNGAYYYIKTDNAVSRNNNGTIAENVNITPLISYTYDGTNVTDFTIRQPVRLATTEMLDKVQDQVDSKQDTLVSGTNIKTINSTTVLGSGNFTLADQSLSNLDSTGQMVVDSQNGTISNCILEIPQNVKIELSGSTITIKAGTTIVRTGTTYTTVTTTQDYSRDISGYGNGDFLIFTNKWGSYIQPRLINKLGSGSTLPADNTTYYSFYLTTNSLVYDWKNETSEWIEQDLISYPLVAVHQENGVLSFLKDSKGRDLIFNGCGYIGHHYFSYPNIKSLISYGFNEDDSLKSLEFTSNSLKIGECFNAQNYNCITSDGFVLTYEEVETLPNNPTIYKNYYIKDMNRVMLYDGSSWSPRGRTYIAKYLANNNMITDFIIRQPYEGARNLLTDDIEEEVATKQADVTTLTGYDSTKTQTLKNVNGTLTWVDD